MYQLGLLTVLSVVVAHGGTRPPEAPLDAPTGVGTVADQSFLISWSDYDAPVTTGTATIELYYTQTNPMTFRTGLNPPDADGTPIAKGILESDLTNELVWDTSTVSPGTYWVWSRVVDPPDEGSVGTTISLSPGVLTVAHPGDPVHPAAIVSRPADDFSFSNQHFDLEYRTFDPDGTATVKLEAAHLSAPESFVLLSDQLEALPVGTYGFDTSELEEGFWFFRITISDARGLSFSAFSRHFLYVTHSVPDDAGIADVPDSVDAAVVSEPDAGVVADAGSGAETPDEGCGCQTSAVGGTAWTALLVVLLFALGRFGRLSSK